MPLDLNWVLGAQANTSAIERRAGTIGARRSVKKAHQAAWLLRAVTCIDLTTLSGDDTDRRVARLCAKARQPVAPALLDALGMEPITTGAVCVYHEMIPAAVAALRGSNIPVAAVSTGFPAGLSPFELRLREIEMSVAAGATEIDIVISRRHVLSGNWQALYDEMQAMRAACGEAHVKAILATGELGSLRNVARASLVCMMAGADFIKTSTGKESVNATLPVSLVMIRAIRDYYDHTGIRVGYKPAGGISKAKDAVTYLALIKEELGDRWLRPDLFRFGASSLLNDIERQLEHYVTGNYSAGYRHATSMAQLMESELPDAEALGVCGQIIPWNFPLLMLAWKIAPALAMGNTVVLKPAEYTSLTALLFADICRQAGLPKGVVNIVTGDGAVGEMIVAAEVDKIAFTGSTAVGRRIREATAGSGKALSLELGGKSPYIVFDDADLDSAVEGLVDAIWFNQGQVCCAGSRLLVHEPVADLFYAKLRARMDKLRIGSPLDKSIDVGALVDPVQLQRVTAMVDANTSGETHVAAGAVPDQGCFYPPTLVTGLNPADTLMQEEIFGPVLVSTTFRTPTEAVQLANNTRYGLAATVWSENINLALDIAPKLAAGIVWVNGTNLMDAAAGFGGVRESGFGREGGWEGLAGYTKPKGKTKPLKEISAFSGEGGPVDGVDRTAKLYIGGKQARPDGGYSAPLRPHRPPKDGPRQPATCGHKSCITSRKIWTRGQRNLPHDWTQCKAARAARKRSRPV
nr:EOG090X08W6 [Artemia franciscana]